MGCESCHGPGSAKMCTQCHTSAMTPDFKYDEMLKKGVHPKKAT